MGTKKAKKSKPEQLCENFDAGVYERELGFDVGSVVHEIIADVLDSYELALREATKNAGFTMSKDFLDDVRTTVEDYIANHYGEL